ncbi:MAG TPA: MdtA/MuxA family multidrug efflux RND transporter periplasmic adaptor subunit [Stellaceae bacterium]|nr:MdtA/MuxA family multidrug efflux RND transporter periplasmic adaptor subunit [Stellaceae bacterium]
MNDQPNRYAPADGRDTALRPVRRGSRLMRQLGVVLAILLVLAVGAWYLIPSGSGPAGRFAQNGPTPVVTQPARSGDMPIILNGLGTVTPLATVTVKTQISGTITQIAFTEGQMVKQGDFLVQIDPRPYQVALEQAEGTLARDQALLANAKVDLARYTKLVAEDSIAEQQLATQRALVAQDEGNVKTDQGQVDAAKLNLVYCHIIAPVAGRVGLRLVDLGNYVTPGDANGLVVLTQLQPITVVFTLPEDNIPQVMKRLLSGAQLPVTAFDRSHATKLADGTVLTVDNEIDTSTGTLKVKASFPNEDDSLFPNQFVNVDLLLDTQHNATLVPQSAVQRGAPGTYVYVVKDDTAAVRPITLGPGNANDIAITKGIAVGEAVVTDGADRLKDGAKVTIPAANGGGAAGAGGKPQGADQQGQGQDSQQHHHRRQNEPGGQDSNGNNSQSKPQ